jgi:4-hydroxy-4-methyl-2-oxoglutarate aldolase
MPVTIHAPPPSDLTKEEIDPWRDVPVAIAVDLLRDQGQMDPGIRPINPPGRQPKLLGRAVTALCEPPDFGAVLHALDRIMPGDVLMIAAGGHRVTAMIGEILGGHLRRRGGAGLVCDGAIRDIATLSQWPDFSVFTRWVTPRGPTSLQAGSVNAPVTMGGRLVTPGDLVIGDDDGLVALSPDMVRRHTTAARAKLAREAEWITSLADGRTVEQTFGLAPAINSR